MPVEVVHEPFLSKASQESNHFSELLLSVARRSTGPEDTIPRIEPREELVAQ